MSEATFTPGPWRVRKPGHGHATKYRCVQIGKDENYSTLELRPEDARLIAAAPDLLKCCLDALTTDNTVLPMEVGCAMEAAIEKATGKTLDELYPETQPQ